MTVAQLNDQFAMHGAVSFEDGPGGLVRIVIRGAGAEAHVSTHGAHVTHWRPPGGEPALFMSEKSWFEPGRPIRGGVPVCWPWFGMSDAFPGGPHHGFARITEWDVESASVNDRGRVVATLLLTSNDETRSIWPHDFELRHVVTVGPTLTMRLETRNTGSETFTVTEALHTYLRVSDARKVSVRGLEGAVYLDETAGFAQRRQDDTPITITAETDRCYQATTATCILDDPGFRRKITVEKSGSNSTIVWNPWIDKAAAMPDFGDDEWPRMVCIETANAFDDAVTIAPGEAHAIQAIVSVV